MQLPAKVLPKCGKCGDTFYSVDAYKAHRKPVVDGRVEIVPAKWSRTLANAKVWLMEHDGPGGTGLVTVRQLSTFCT